MKKILEFGLGTILGLGALTAPVCGMMPAAMAQGDLAVVHGKVVDPGGLPFDHGEIKFSTDKTTPEAKRIYRYTFPVNKDATYSATGIAPGDYLIVVYADGKTIDFQNVVLKLHDDKTVDFDMTRAEYLNGLTPEARKALEEAKKKNAGAMAENAKIADLNKTIVQANADEKAGKPDAAVAALTPLTVQRPDEPVIWGALGQAQLALADQATDAARAAKTSVKDPAIQQKYSDAAASYQKALDLAAAKPPKNANDKNAINDLFAYNLNLGQALGRSGKPTEAAVAYENAAKAKPDQAGTALYNEAATFFNANKLPEAAAAADRAIAADPKRAETYYIKASSLVPDAKLDEKTKKFVLPPGCLEAYQMYLQLAPTGAHSADVKGLLDSLGQPQKSSFRSK